LGLTRIFEVLVVEEREMFVPQLRRILLEGGGVLQAY